MAPSAFDFYLSFCGPLPGLIVAEVASGFRDAIAVRQNTRLGWLTPLPAVFVFLDINCFSVNFRGIRVSIRIPWARCSPGWEMIVNSPTRYSQNRGQSALSKTGVRVHFPETVP